jgi:hypothetical protein
MSAGQSVALRVRGGARYEQMPANLRERLEAMLGSRAAARVAFEAQDGTVVATRQRARELIAAHPDLDGGRQVVLDASGVEVASPPFLDELVAAWPGALLVNFNDDVAAAWDLVIERRFP